MDEIIHFTYVFTKNQNEAIISSSHYKEYFKASDFDISSYESLNKQIDLIKVFS